MVQNHDVKKINLRIWEESSCFAREIFL